MDADSVCYLQIILTKDNFFSNCDCGFQYVCPLMEKDKRLMEASW